MNTEYITSLTTLGAADRGERKSPAFTYQEGKTLDALAGRDLAELDDILESILGLLFIQRTDYFDSTDEIKILCEHSRAAVYSKAGYMLSCYARSIVTSLFDACDMHPPRKQEQAEDSTNAA